jgi:uncharacterized SAM-binding protein YcdF (DUF218 family)
LIYSILKSLALPPASLFLVAVVALIIGRRWRRTGQLLLILTAVCLYLLCTPVVSALLMRGLHQAEPLSEAPGLIEGAKAIVVLSADVLETAPEYGGATVGGLTLERLRYGAHLHRLTGLPILVAGGSPGDIETAASALMAKSLEEDFGLSARWQETASLNTSENASRSAEILRREGIERILLVTHAWHMPRAVPLFEDTGLKIVPAPTGFISFPDTLSLQSFLPSSGGLSVSRYAVYEYLGRLRDWITGAGAAARAEVSQRTSGLAVIKIGLG